jgi:hypothetical protein
VEAQVAVWPRCGAHVAISSWVMQALKCHRSSSISVCRVQAEPRSGEMTQFVMILVMRCIVM